MTLGDVEGILGRDSLTGTMAEGEGGKGGFNFLNGVGHWVPVTFILLPKDGVETVLVLRSP